LGDILDALPNLESTFDDVSHIGRSLLRTVIKTVANRKEQDTNIMVRIKKLKKTHHGKEASCGK
jgi:arginine/ornithine N-succinyltransferase beta subunit